MKNLTNRIYSLDCLSIFNTNIANLINIIKKHLLIIYKSNRLNILLFKSSKYLILSVILLALITFLFNKNLDYFYNFTIAPSPFPLYGGEGDIFFQMHFSLKILTFFFITIYLCYIKFNLLTRMFALIKGIPFFYSEKKKNYIEDIKIICIYFYILNLFFISISILFIINLTNNIFIINYDLGMLISYLTNITSILILLFYFNKIINKKFIINKNEINPLKILLLIVIVLTPFILLNLYSDRINTLLGEYNIFKFSSIQGDSTEDSNYNDRLKEGTNIIITNNTSTSNTTNFINSNNNSNINTTTKPISKLNEAPSPFPHNGGEGRNLTPFLLREGSGSRINVKNLPIDTNTPTLKMIYLNELPEKIFKKIFNQFIEYKKNGTKEFKYYLKNPIYYNDVEYKINENLIKFLKSYLNKIITDNNNKNLDTKQKIKFINRLYEKTVEFNYNLNLYKENYKLENSNLERLKILKYLKYIGELINYKDFIFDDYLPAKELKTRLDRDINNLKNYNKEIYDDVKLFKNTGIFNKILNKFTKKNKKKQKNKK